MTGVVDVIGLVAAILRMARQIIELAGAAQRNTEKCKFLSDHVKTIDFLLSELKKHKIPQWTNELLQNLNDALEDGVILIQSCQKKRTWSHVFKTQKKAKKFDALDQQISRILQRFHIGNMILIVSMDNGRFFENVLQKLLQDGAFKRLPENVKEELESSIMRLSNTDNMSSNAHELLEWIKRDITYSFRDAATSGSSGAQRGKTASSTDHYAIVMVDILELTKKIVANKRENIRGEIHRLVHLVEQVATIIQHLQTSELWLDHNTRTKTLVDLKKDLEKILEKILDCISLYKGKEHNKVKMVIFCATDNAYEYDVLKYAYKIEYYIQVLLIALRQLYEQPSYNFFEMGENPNRCIE